MPPPVTRLPIETGPEWVPVAVTLVKDGSAVTSPAVSFAVLPRYTGPESGDWVAATVDPGGSGALGCVVQPVGIRAEYGVWAMVGTGSLDTVVLAPDEVGYIYRY